MAKEISKNDDEWRSQLSEEEYRVMREAGTEAPFSGKYNLHFENGTYNCNACGAHLFDSSAKFDSHCGWPSFDAESVKDSIREIVDARLGMIRTEIVCATCDSHLGHVFPDGPTSTGLRYCVNSASLDFDKED